VLICDDKKFGQGQLWMPFMPEDFFRPDPELQAIGAILDDPETLQPFVDHHARAVRETGLNLTGRNTVPLRAFAAMMVLKHMFDLDYRGLCKAVADRISWRVFCHIQFGKRVPDYSTICKLAGRFGHETVTRMNTAILAKLKAQGKLKGKKIKVDTTVVESNIAYPTDTGLLRKGINKIGRLAKKARKAGVSVKGFVDHARKARKIALSVAKTLAKRSGDAVQEVRAAASELATVAEDSVRRADQVLRRLKRSAAKSDDAKKQALAEELETICGRVAKAIDQTRRVAEGETHIEDRLVSIFDAEARPIRKGKAGKPVEFGYKAVLASNEQGFIFSCDVREGNPNDATLFVPEIARAKDNTGFNFKEAAGDRGMYSADNERDAKDMGIEHVATPKRGKKSAERVAHERQAWFRRLCRMRAGQEAEISRLKRRFSFGRSRSRGRGGVRTWAGWSVAAYNLVVAAGL